MSFTPDKQEKITRDDVTGAREPCRCVVVYEEREKSRHDEREKDQNGMNSHLWVIGGTLSLTATLFGTLGKVLLKLSHTSSSQTLSVKAAATLCVVMLSPVFDAMSYASAAQVRRIFLYCCDFRVGLAC
ncbi:hypothetical protein PsorP6_003209 [Peronosclerospora sorghi]|uniref:Uncharacterized protein n=1 Tax=Peronosclerospora sorghi TaxID=230839 RepID=A0ACC0VPD5_9STRA|nr:hypothetical protein PsorP6_003209 [Peronosclerospora sorghi]